ncbi:probable JmjC domain-containing histone demethylation protein 2C isoform X2 [Megalops cyprinoides]|uniref:probable JmjC domain-containing histone demethylation protein 2C isoform X2 n=1 Tax=Megalops cyprinoides TaxID=118141 RepID=UPI001864DA64|nr:probable JmjC domain-containing histone demethylation protein 2C isoform X2 [Megalops cyprinoides]
MAVEARPELVGKRFLCVSGEELLELGEIGRWGWRAGVIRAVSHRDNDNPELTVYVEFDDLEWEKREWVKVYEDFQIFLLEHQLVWAKRKESTQVQGTKAKQIQWPALTFKPLVGKTVLGSITAVEFFSDRQLDFLTDDGAYQPYQDEVDSLNPVLRDNPQLHEEVKAWVKDQKVQEIFMQGPYSLNGYRVRVYRQDSATQWFTGIITHHDLFSRTMIVMNDQVLEPQNVDPSMVQMTFLDDVVHSLLKGENIGITSRRRSRSSQNSNTAHTSGGRPTGTTGSTQGHYTRAQANSPRPVMNSSGSAPKQAGQQAGQQQQQQQQQGQQPLQGQQPPQGQQQGQQQQQQQQQQQSPGQQRGSRSGRRKGSDSSVPDDDKIKEEKADSGGRGDLSKSKSKQMANKRRKPEEDDKKVGLKRLKPDNASDFSESSDSENSNKRAADSSSEQNSENELKGKSTSKAGEAEEEEEKSQSSKAGEEPARMDRLSPREEMEGDEKSSSSSSSQAELAQSADCERREEKSPLQPAKPPTPCVPEAQGCIVEMKSTVKTLPKDHYVSAVTAARTQTPKCVIDITDDGSARPGSRESSEAVSALLASQKSELYIPEPRHLVLKPSASDCRKLEAEQQMARSLGSKIEFAHSEVIRPVTSVSESAAVAEREKVQQYSSIVPCIKSASVAEDARKSHKMSPSPDVLKPKSNPSPEILKPKCNPSPDIIKSKTHGVPETTKPKPNTSPEVSKHKIRYQDSAAGAGNRAASKAELDAPRSSFKPVPARGAAAESTKSPLIIDKNEHFTVYRDPALVRPETETNHIAYLHQHLHPLHASSHPTCLTPNTHHPSHLLPGSPINAHTLSGATHPSVHHPHLLPSVLSGMPPASLLGGHPRLDSGHAGGLGHLALAHHHPHQQQQFLQQQPPPPLLAQTHTSASYNQLGLYPIIWQYPNGTHTYPGLGLPSSKWVHPENAVNSEASLRRNTPSPWLHQHTPVTSADSLGLLSHVPVRPASAEPHRPIKISAHASPPLSKTAGDLHREELEKKAFMDPIRTITSAHLKQDQDRSRTPTGKDGHVPRLFLDPLSGHGKQQRPAADGGDRANKYKEENRRILQESIEVAPFTAKIRPSEPERDAYPRIPSLPAPAPKAHGLHTEKELEHPAAELYKLKHAAPQTLPQSTYFTTLSNSVVNEPPRLYPSKELNSYFEKVSGGGGSCGSSQSAASSPLAAYGSKPFSKPPPLIKHQPEGEGLVGKITEQLSQQVALHPVGGSGGERRSPAMSPSNPLRCMPALHRAPVFHPPTQQTLDRKEGGYGRLSPPTLTPIQPVSSAGKVSEQQKPPTLLPELREVGGAGKGGPEMSSSEAWKAGDSQAHDKPGWHPEKSGAKPQAATASVIVRPSTCIKYDGSPGPRTAAKEPAAERPFAGKNQTDCLKAAEGREPGRVILPNTNLEDACAQYKKNFMRAAQAGVPGAVVAPANSVCNTKTDVTTSAAPGVLSRAVADAAYSALGAAAVAAGSAAPRGAGHLGAELCQEGRSRTTSPGAFLPPGAGGAAPASVGPAYSGNFIHLKKHKAALAAAQSRSSGTAESEPGSAKAPPCSAPAAQDSPAPGNAINKTGSLTNGQPAQLSQPNYHKLKKAWLTRHSEEDRNTNKAEKLGSAVSEIIKPCTVSLIASTSSDVEISKEGKGQEDKMAQEDKKTRRGAKRTYESGSESAEDSDESESKSEQRAKRQPKPTYKKKQNDMQKRKGDNEKEEDEVKPNGIFRSAREKTKLKLASSNGIPRSVLKDWRKVKKLKQTGESFLQDDSCSEIGPNLQKCRECRVVRSKKGEEPAHSPVFCRFYYFRRLSYSKNGVIRIDGFSSPDQYDEEAVSLWAPDSYEDNELDLETSKYILSYIGDKFCQLVMTENTAATWIKKDAKIAWKRAVRGVREMCDACEATLFNIHWVCQKCGFVVCLDCYKAKERKSSKDKELYAWLKCVKGQPHDHKHLMPTQIIPGTVLTDLVNAMHVLREKYGIKSHCACTGKHTALLNKIPSTNGVSQVLQNVLNHSNKLSLCKPDAPQQNPSQKVEANGGSSPASDTSTDSKLTPPESQSPLHFLADLAEQKSREEKKENKESPLGKAVKEEKDHPDSLESLHCKSTSLVSNSTEQGSTLRDLLTTTAGKLRLGSTDAGIAFAPVYSTASQTGKSGRSMPNILDDIIASVVENKIPASRSAKLSLKQEVSEEPKVERKKASAEEPPKLHADIPHSWLYDRRLLWLKDHRNPGNWKLFRECWKQGQPVLVSGVHKKLNASLWKAESFNQEFADHQGDLLNCKDGVVSNSGIKEFWDGFEDLTKRPKSKDGDTMVYRLKDWPSGEEFMALMPSRYDDLMKNLPLPEYSDPEGNLNLASHLPTFFVRPDLGPRLCCAYGVAASQEQDFGTANLHLEVSDIVSVLVYVGVAKGNGVLSKTGVLKRLEEEDLDDSVKKRLKDSSETPGALWHIYVSKDVDKIKEFLHKVAKEQGVEVPAEQDPIREPGWYLSRKLRQRLLEEYGVQGWTVVQFLGDSVLIPAGAMHQVQNLHSCVQVINDFVSPEHVVHSFHLTQELRSSKEEINYEDKLQVKNIFYHCVKNAVGTLKRCCTEEQDETEENS